MRKCGEVTYTDAHYRSGEGKGEVCFATRDDQDCCMKEMEGFEINGKKISVSRGVSILFHLPDEMRVIFFHQQWCHITK